MKKVLILDDDPAVLYMMKEALEYSNYEVETAEKSEDAFRLVEAYAPDLIFVDYILGGINGGEFCHQIKSNPKTGFIPIVIFSAYTKLLLSLGDYGCDAILPKPFGLEDLIKTVKTWTTTEAIA